MATVGKARFVGKTSDDRRQIEEKAKKKSLWGQIGRTAGGLLATVLTGGAASPLVAAAAAGTGTLAGGMLGSGLHRSKYGEIASETGLYSSSADALQEQLGILGTDNIGQALTSAATAGIGQKLSLAKDARAATAAGKSAEEVEKIGKGVGFKDAFKDSPFTKGLGKFKANRLEARDLKRSQSPIGQYVADRTNPLPLNMGEEVFTESDMAMGTSAYDMYSKKAPLLMRAGDRADQFGQLVSDKIDWFRELGSSPAEAIRSDISPGFGKYAGREGFQKKSLSTLFNE